MRSLYCIHRSGGYDCAAMTDTVPLALHLTTLSAAPLRISVALDELVDVTGGRSVSCGVRLLVEVDAAVQAARLRGDAARLRQVCVSACVAAVDTPVLTT